MIISCMVGMSVTASAGGVVYTFNATADNWVPSGDWNYTFALTPAQLSKITKIEVLIYMESIAETGWGTVTYCKGTSGAADRVEHTANFENTPSIKKYTAGEGVIENADWAGVQLVGKGKLLAYTITFSEGDPVSAGDWRYPEITFPTGLTATVGQTLADVALPTATNGTWSWSNSSTSVGEAGEKTFPAKFTPSDASLNTIFGINVPVTVSGGDPQQPQVTITPEDAGSITYNYNQENSQWELTAVPATGYKFVQWAYFEGEGHAPEPSTSTDVTLIVTDDMEDLTAYFEAVTEPDGIPITTLKVGDVLVPGKTYVAVIDGTHETNIRVVNGKCADGGMYTGVEYKVTVNADGSLHTNNSDAGDVIPIDENGAAATVWVVLEISDPTSVQGVTWYYIGAPKSQSGRVDPEPDPHIEPAPGQLPPVQIHMPPYPGRTESSSTAALPSSPETGVAPAPVKDVGGVKDVTNTDENVGGAFIDEELAALIDAVLDDETKAAIANGESVDIYLTVQDGEYSEAAAALAEKLGYTVGKFLDISLYVKKGDVVTQEEETGMLKVSIKLSDDLINTNPDVIRTYVVVRIHNGKVDVLETKYDPDTKTLSFFTDKFSSYIIAFIDEAIAEPDPDTVIGDEDDDDTEEVEVDADTDKAEDAPAVVDAGETNPHTGVTADAFALVLLAGAVMFVSRKRK